MEDEHGRAQVSARGNSQDEAIGHARQTFDHRRIWTPEERKTLGRASEAISNGLGHKL